MRRRRRSTGVRAGARERAPSPGWSGATASCAQIRQALDDVLAGTGGILFITGEAGIGKSRLVSETQELFAAAGPGVRAAACGWRDAASRTASRSPTGPYRDLVREWLGAGDDDPELRVRVSLRRAVERLFGDRTMEIYPYLGAMLGLALEPEAAARLAELSPEALQYRTFEVVGSLLARLADDGPGRGRDRGPALGRRDVGAADRAAARR